MNGEGNSEILRRHLSTKADLQTSKERCGCHRNLHPSGGCGTAGGHEPGSPLLDDGETEKRARGHRPQLVDRTTAQVSRYVLVN